MLPLFGLELLDTARDVAAFNLPARGAAIRGQPLNPQHYIADLLARIADYRARRIAELLPWNWQALVIARLVNGQWAPGRSGNPGGRPGGVAKVRELAQSHSAAAIACLVKEMRHGDTSHARIAAANALLDRGWGRPTQPLPGDPEEPPIGIEIPDEERRRRAIEAIDEAFREYSREE